MPSKDMGGMRGSGAGASGYGQYGRGGAKPVKPNRPANRKPVVHSNELVKKGLLPASRYQKSISPYQTSTPVKPSSKKGAVKKKVKKK